MNIIENDKLKDISGGISINGALITSISKLINTVVDLGRFVGSAVRRMTVGKYCLN